MGHQHLLLAFINYKIKDNERERINRRIGGWHVWDVTCDELTAVGLLLIDGLQDSFVTARRFYLHTYLCNFNKNKFTLLMFRILNFNTKKRQMIPTIVLKNNWFFIFGVT